MKLEIISPERILYQGEAGMVMLPGIMGNFTILENHAPIVSVLKNGVVSYGSTAETTDIKIESGFVEANNNKVTVCVEV